MTANPWDKFFWNDWENDPGLKLCTLSAQGLWMRILCICAKADPKGYLVVAGQSLSAADLASLAGKPQPEIESLLRELSNRGVSSTDRTGRIYNRRMVRDVKKAKVATENGKKGGNPSLLSVSEISASDNQPDKPEVKPHKPSAISQEPNEKVLPADAGGSKPKGSIYSEDFAQFWKSYPRVVNASKKDAFREWLKLPLEKRVAATAAISGFKRYCAANTWYQPIYPDRFLKQERFEGYAADAEKTLTPEQVAENADRADRVMRRGKYAEGYEERKTG